MLEHIPAWIGHALNGVRAGSDKLAITHVGLDTAAVTVTLSSPAFANDARLPTRFTADGEGVSPPLVWGPLPDGTAALALIVEDADAPAPQPLVHAIVWALPPDTQHLAEGAIAADDEATGEVGRNSYLRTGWLPPDPPTGHGAHRYVFQLFALDTLATLGDAPGRAAVVEAIHGHVIGAGVLVGTYSRGEPAATGLVGSIADPLPAA